MPEIENVITLLAETSLCEHDQQKDASAYLRELEEEEGEADI